MNSRSDVVARMRGALVGSVSGAVSIAAHGIGGGGMPPSESAVVLLIAVCAAVGAMVSAIRVSSHRTAFVVAVLAAGQVAGHASLAVATHQSHGLQLSASMIAAHVVATIVAAGLIRSAERACLIALAALSRIVLIVLAPRPVDTGTWTATPVYRAKLALWLLVNATAGTRAPPALI
ncbi:hypothetical protein [Rhodococcus opacus]|nr:hypothetical protein [Rhodococcus opacus]